MLYFYPINATLKSIIENKNVLMFSNCTILIYYADESLTGTKGSTLKPKAGPPYPQSTVPAERFMENRLRDLLLDIEDRIYQGTLGAIKVC